MNDNDLSKYFLICKEIDILEKEIANQVIKADEYISNEEYINALKNYVNKLTVKKFEAELEKFKIEDFMDKVKDPEIRVILRLRYVQMMTWEQVGEEVFMSSSGAFRKCKRFLASHTKGA